MKTWLKVTLGIFAVLIVLGIIGSIVSPPETNYETGNAIKEGTEKTQEELTILNHQMEVGEYGNIYVRGLAENTAGKNLNYAEIKVKFYDKDGALIETFLDNVNDLGESEKWSFEVVYPRMDTERVEDYEISVGSVF